MRVSWRLSWLLVVPALSMLIIWGARTADMYSELGLRNLGDHTLGGMSLHRAGVLQWQFMRYSLSTEIREAISGRHEPALPRFHLFVQDADLRELDSHRPASGFNYVNGRILNGEQFSKVKVRYRGDFAVHWGFFKRSWRIKTRKEDLFQGMRKFNLIAPKTEYLYSNHFGYELARTVGLMAPRSELVYLNLNGRHQGVYLLVQQIDESLLRDHGRMPGDIYSGDELYGQDIWHGVGTPMFETPGVWEKTAFNNHYPESSIYPLEQLLLAVDSADLAALESLVDLEAFARLALWENIAVSSHLDASHNWRLYFDPATARFSPILWDGLPFSDFWIPADWQTSDWKPGEVSNDTPLMVLLRQSPRFIETKNRLFREFVHSDKPDELRRLLHTINGKASQAVQLDFPMANMSSTWVHPDQAAKKMQDNAELLDRILDSLADRYPDPPGSAVSARPAFQVWNGTITFESDTEISDPVRIQPGTRIHLAPAASLFFRHQLLIEGTEALPVVFGSSGAEPFGAIVLEGSNATGSRLSGFSISNGSGHRNELRLYSGMLSIHDVQDVRLASCTLADNTKFDDQLHVVYSTLTIEGCSFSNAPMDAVDLDMSQARITRSRFSGNGNDGLDLMGSTVSASDLDLEDNGDKGISVGERSTLTIEDSRFRNNGIAIQIKDDSHVKGRHLSVTGSRIAFDAYKKNWRYGSGGRAGFCDTMIHTVDQVINTDKHSSISLNPVNCADSAILLTN